MLSYNVSHLNSRRMLHSPCVGTLKRPWVDKVQSLNASPSPQPSKQDVKTYSDDKICLWHEV
jgi:hypothetical protein